MVKPVIAGENGDGVAERDAVHADATVSCAAIAHILFRDRAFGQGLDGAFGCWAGCVAGLVLFHKLADNAVEGFLAVDRIAVDAACWCEVVEELKQGSWEDWSAVCTAVDVAVIWRMQRREGTDVTEHLLHELVHVLRLRIERLRSVGVSW